MSLDAEEQEDELLALASIYEDSFTSAQDQEEETRDEETRKGGELAIILDLPSDFYVVGKNARDNAQEEKYHVRHLPPIFVHFTVPPTYPSKLPPSFTLSCKWLNRGQLSQLCRELDRLWEENPGDVIMFTWAQFLKDETLNLLGFTDTLNVENIRPVRQSSLTIASDSPVANQDSGIVDDELTSRPSLDHTKSTARPSLEDTKSADTLSLEDIKSTCSPSLQDIKSTDSPSLEDTKTDRPSLDDTKSTDRPSFDDTNGASDIETVITGATSLTLSRQNSLTYDSRTIQDIAPKANLLKILRDYDEEIRKKVFGTKTFDCKVCFIDKAGANCLEFWPCRHVYCKECMASYFKVQIGEGNIKCLRCPEDKCDSEANPKQVQELVPDALYQRWESMLLSSTLSSLGDIQLCPRIHCQYPVTMEDRQGHCPSCKFVFCAVCRYGWHGVEPCRLRKGELQNIMESYLNGNGEVRRGLEDRYGRKYLSTLKDEYLSMSYLEQNSKSCPKCGAKIEKIDGCNKMTCQYCNIYFCWLCMQLLNKSRPYDHFNRMNSPCFNQLFAGVEVDDDFWDESDEDEGDGFYFD